MQVAEGDSPALSSKGQLAYVKDGQIWTAPLPGAGNAAGKPQRLFFDRGKDDTPLWSPDGTRLAFVSDRGDHSFVGVYTHRASRCFTSAHPPALTETRSGRPTAARSLSCASPATAMHRENFLVQHAASVCVLDRRCDYGKRPQGLELARHTCRLTARPRRE